MKRILFSFCLAALVAAQDVSLDELVSKLGDEDYAVREDATQKLIEMGDKAVAPLEEALKSDDLEVRLRAGRALQAIRGSKRRKIEEPDDTPAGTPAEPRASRNASVQMSIAPGKVIVKITEVVDGKPVTKTYEAKSTDELLKEHPELKQHLPSVRFGFGGAKGGDAFDMDRFWKDWNKDFEKHMRRFREDIERDMEQQRGWLEAWRKQRRGFVPELEPPARGPRLGLRATRPSSVIDNQLQLGGKGLVVDAVEKNSLADTLGIRRFDILLELNGKLVHDPRDITDFMATHKPKAKIVAKVMRRARKLELNSER